MELPDKVTLATLYAFKDAVRNALLVLHVLHLARSHVVLQTLAATASLSKTKVKLVLLFFFWFYNYYFLTTCKENIIAYSDKREEANANHYCKLGCASSVCSAITTTLNLDFSAGKALLHFISPSFHSKISNASLWWQLDHVGQEAVQGSVELCNNECSGLCTKSFGAAVLAA